MNRRETFLEKYRASVEYHQISGTDEGDFLSLISSQQKEDQGTGNSYHFLIL
jgi:hypothetical protein